MNTSLLRTKASSLAPMFYPKYPGFYGECTVHGRKGRSVHRLAQWPHDRPRSQRSSSSGLNSVKRLNNDTAAKAKHFATEGGKNIVNVALLSGVFKLSSLLGAQASGLYLVGSHESDGFIDWVRSQ